MRESHWIFSFSLCASASLWLAILPVIFDLHG
jgi:hypothetical protein